MKDISLRFKKWRLWAAWVYFAGFIVFADTGKNYLVNALPPVILGALVRLWASGYLAKKRNVTTSGPYAYVRNPLYVGNFLLGAGFIIPTYSWFWIGLFLVVFALTYYPTVKEEESFLTNKFGREYQDYLASVPAFIPVFRAYLKKEPKGFTIMQSIRNGEPIRIFALLILVVLMAFRADFLAKKDMFTGETFSYIGLICFFAACIVANIFFRRRLDKAEQSKV